MAKKPGPPPEICVYCDRSLVCVWTVVWHGASYAMCNDCAPQAQKDFFSYSMRHLK